MLGTDADGVPVYFEQAQDVAQEYQLETKADGYLPEWSITVEDCQYAIQEKNNLQCRCRLRVDGMMTIYYADAGENIWSIAKRYNTSISAVMEENGLEDEILPEKRIVLIPMVG